MQVYPMYDENLVRPMWQQLADIGVQPLKRPADVDEALLQADGTALVVVNSVCGCAAGSARPGVGLALQHKVIPDRLTTVFAGVDREATARARELMKDVPPSSPSVGLFKDGKLAFFLPRQEIEGRTNEQVALRLIEAFDELCSRPGPSVSEETLRRAFSAS